MPACSHCGRSHSEGKSTCPVTGDAMAAVGPCGTRVDRYLVQRLLGRGGFGAVYEAEHVHLRQPVALKLLKRELSADRDMVDRFLREARAAAAVGNPHIVDVKDCGITPDGQPFLVMELLVGESLRTLAERDRPGAERSVDLVLQILDGLGAAHARGIVHRDVKPANVFVSPLTDPVRDWVKVVDFGVSKIVRSATGQLTAPGIGFGTPAYVAPEQWTDARTADARADLYSVAVILYELLARKRPFAETEGSARVPRSLIDAPEPLRRAAPNVPAPLADVVDRGLARDPDARWQGAAAFSSAILSTTGGTGAGAGWAQTGPPPTRQDRRPAAPSTGGSPARSRRPLFLGAALGLVGAALWAGALAGWLRHRRSASDPGAVAPAGATVNDAKPAQGPPMQPAPAPAPTATAPSTPTPAVPAAPQARSGRTANGKPPPTTTWVGELHTVGTFDAASVRAFGRRIERSLDDCRAPGRVEHVLATVHYGFNGRPSLMGVAPDNHGDPEVARCVARRVGELSPSVSPPLGPGILVIPAVLPAR